MQSITNRHMPVFALLFSLAMLCGAWVFQYGLGYPPCQMCYWQRYAHWGVMGLALLTLVLMKLGIGNARFFALLLGLALLGSMAMGIWHAGVEYGFWPGPASCTATGEVISNEGMTLEQILAEMNEAKPPACSDSPWPNSPISMAGLNAILSLLAALVCFRYASKESADV